jgi:hypothetical protein
VLEYYGGVSYGVFQLSSKMGSVTSFLNATGFAKDFEGIEARKSSI